MPELRQIEEPVDQAVEITAVEPIGVELVVLRRQGWIEAYPHNSFGWERRCCGCTGSIVVHWALRHCCGGAAAQRAEGDSHSLVVGQRRVLEAHQRDRPAVGGGLSADVQQRCCEEERPHRQPVAASTQVHDRELTARRGTCNANSGSGSEHQSLRAEVVVTPSSCQIRKSGRAPSRYARL